jgi:protein required for attachment to host cells
MPALKTYPENKILKTHHTPHVLVVVADAREAVFYSCKPNSSRPHLSRIAALQAEKITFQSEPGRSHESVGTARHAIAPHTDPKEDSRQTFARAIGKKLEEEFGKSGFENLVLIAAPKVLGDLRAALSENLKRALIAEAGKELTGANETELADYLIANRLV